MRKKLYYKIHRQGYTQKALAEKLQVTEAWMSLIVNGRRRPSLYLLTRMSEELGMSEEEILCNEEI